MSNSDELDTQSLHPAQRTKSMRTRVEVDPVLREWFEQDFWPLYPRHEGKQPALTAAALKATSPEKRSFYLDRLKQQLPTYAERKSAGGQQVIPMAATWFNQDRAEDDLRTDLKATVQGRFAASHQDYPEYVPLPAAGRSVR
jgi:hypothetical protein